MPWQESPWSPTGQLTKKYCTGLGQMSSLIISAISSPLLLSQSTNQQKKLWGSSCVRFRPFISTPLRSVKSYNSKATVRREMYRRREREREREREDSQVKADRQQPTRAKIRVTLRAHGIHVSMFTCPGFQSITVPVTVFSPLESRMNSFESTELAK